jgi:hypothetical protein
MAVVQHACPSADGVSAIRHRLFTVQWDNSVARPGQPFHCLAAWDGGEDWQGTCYELVQSEDSVRFLAAQEWSLGIGLSYATVQRSYRGGLPVVAAVMAASTLLLERLPGLL